MMAVLHGTWDVEEKADQRGWLLFPASAQATWTMSAPSPRSPLSPAQEALQAPGIHRAPQDPWVPGTLSQQSCPPGRPFLPSVAVLGPSSRVVPVLFFLRCFFLLACGDGGGSSFGLAALEMFGLELSESAVPLAGNKDKASHA